MPARPEPLRWTVEKAATEFDIDRRTLTKRLRTSDVEPGADGKYSTMQIVRAIFGDSESERTRKIREEADKISLQNAKTRGEMVEADTIYKSYEGVFVAIRQTIMASNLADVEKADLMANLRHDITEAQPTEL